MIPFSQPVSRLTMTCISHGAMFPVNEMIVFFICQLYHILVNLRCIYIDVFKLMGIK